MNSGTPVVVLRSGHHGGLGIVRSLGRLGVSVYCVDAARSEAAFTSRYCRARFLLDTMACPAGEAIFRLLEIGARIGGRPILIPTTDEGAAWVAENAEALQERFLFSCANASLIRLLIDKGRMQLLARRFGLPTARAMVPASRDDIEAFIETADFPVMAKATDADRLRRLTGRTKFLIDSPGQLRALYAKAQDGREPNFLVQEFIPGEDWMFNGYFDANSNCLFGATGKKIRRFPPDTGITSLGICLQNQTVFDQTIRFMRTLGYRGILDIGYRFDRRDGAYKVLDINPRIGCTFRLFAAGDGMDVVRALYLDITGQRQPSAHIAEGRKWIVEDFDLLSALKSIGAGRLKLSHWIRSLRGIHETACFAWDDPLPFFMMGVTDWVEFLRWARRNRRSTAAAAGSADAVHYSNSR